MKKILKRLNSRTCSNRHKKSNSQGFNDKHSFRKIIKITLFLAIAVMVAASILQIILPVKPFKPDVFAEGFFAARPKIRQSESKPEIKMDHSVRAGLFKPSRRVNGNSYVDKTVQDIFKSLKLQCIMPIGGQKVAYIVLKKGQLRKCKVGDTVKDMFTVIDIQSDNVNIDILGNRLTLRR